MLPTAEGLLLRYWLTTLPLIPVILPQAFWVRRVMPRLPEAAGPREGSDGDSGPLVRLLVLGDSAAAGVGVEDQRQALVGQLVQDLVQDHRVHWRLEARTGLTSGELLQQLESASWPAADLVVLSIGVNDVTAGTSLTRWQANLEGILQQLTGRLACQRVMLTSVPPMHAFPALPQPLRWTLGRRARLLDQRMQSVAARHPRARWLPLTLPMEARYMATDGFHPAADAYQIWARMAADQLRDWTLS